MKNVADCKLNGEKVPTFSEKELLKELLQASEHFAAFYESERRKVQAPICWAQSSSLPDDYSLRPGLTAQVITTKDKHVVIVRRIPVDSSDCLALAHEMAHLVLYAEGFPAINVGENADSYYFTVIKSLNSMVHDPLVNRKLQSYGFELLDYYRSEVDNAFELFEQGSSQLDVGLDLLRNGCFTLQHMHWIVNYVSVVLEYESIRGEGKMDFLTQFDSRYQSPAYQWIAECGRDLLALVESVGYDEPEKQFALFESIIDRYGIDGVEVVFPSREMALK
jgi:hypothetical protein